MFNPEFLTERTAKLDMLTQARIIFGGDKNLRKILTKEDIDEGFRNYQLSRQGITEKEDNVWKNMFV